MIRNVVFDLGDVLIRWKPAEFLRRFTSNEVRVEWFLRNVIESELWNSWDQGLHSMAHVRKVLLKRFPENADLLGYWFDHWLEIFAPIPATVDLLHNLKANGYHLFALSNCPKETYEYVSNSFDFFHMFDGQVISYQVQRTKPDKEIYRILLAKYNLIGDECAFIDDVPSSVETANRLGIHAILFTTITDVKQELRSLGVTI